MDEHDLSTPPSSPRWLHPLLHNQAVHHVSYHQQQQQQRCGMGYNDGNDQTPTGLPVAPPSPYGDSSYSPSTTTPDLAGLSILDVGSASSELTPLATLKASPLARVDAPSFLPYNFTIPDHLQAKGQAKQDLQEAPARPAAEPALVETTFKVPLSVMSAVAAAASLAPVQQTKPIAVKPKRTAAAARQAKPQQRRIAPKTKRPASAPTARQPSVEAVTRVPPSEPLNNDDNTQQGWEKIMQTVDTQDAKLQRNKWWWYLLAEKTRLTQSGGGMAVGAGPDLEKAQGAIEHHHAMMTADSGLARSAASSPPASVASPPRASTAADGPTAATYDPMPLLTVEAVSPSPSPSPSLRSSPALLYSTSEEEEGGDDDEDYNPDMIITNDDDDGVEEEEDEEDQDHEDDDADWRPQPRVAVKPRPLPPKKRNTQRRTQGEAKGATISGRGRGRCRALRGTPGATAASVHGRDLDEGASLVACNSPPKRRRVGSISGSGGALQPTAQASAPAAAAAAGGRAGDSEPANRKLPPRSRLKGLIEWMKSSGDVNGLPGGLPGGHHPTNNG